MLILTELKLFIIWGGLVMENKGLSTLMNMNHLENGEDKKQYVVKVDLAEIIRANTEAMIAGYKLGLYQREVSKNEEDNDDQR